MSKVAKFVFHVSVSYTEMNDFVDFFQHICAYKYVLGHHTKILIQYVVMQLYICHIQPLANSNRFA